MADCQSHVDELRVFLKQSPCDQNDEQADYAIKNGVVDQMRIEIIKRVSEFRKG